LSANITREVQEYDKEIIDIVDYVEKFEILTLPIRLLGAVYWTP
jgi:hypothetical protein